VTRPLYFDTSSVWETAPDQYSERVDFEIVAERHNVLSSDPSLAG